MAATSTYREHCVVDEAWLAQAAANPADARLQWHDKIGLALSLVNSHLQNLDRYVEFFRWARHRDASGDIGTFKASFFKSERTLQAVRARAEEGFQRLRELLADTPQPLRARSLHTYAGAAAIWFIRSLQRFEGSLIAPSGSTVIRLFPDLPNLRQLRGPFVGIPFDDPVNLLAYGEEAHLGFLCCRICRGSSESDYEYAHRPRYEAEKWQDARPATLPARLYFGWVLPQWVLLHESEPPPGDKWWISVLQDEIGQERYMEGSETPWTHDRRSLESQYVWHKDFEHAWLGDDQIMPVWTMRTARPTVPAACKVFISYSHEDRHWMEEITKCLGPAQLEGLVTVFTDRDIGDGEDWHARLDRELRGARVAILLVTTSFLSSPFIKNHEIPLLLERGDRGELDLRPILVDHVDFGVTKWTSHLQLRTFEDNRPLARA